MKTLNTFQKWMTAITFAEAGEWETARELTPAAIRSRTINKVQKTFMAAAFAEEGLHAEAIAMVEGTGLQSPDPDAFLRSLGLGGIRMTYGVFATESAR